MGKPFKEELKKIESTVRWVNTIEIDKLRKTVLSLKRPIYIIGSGGSLSAAYYFEYSFSERGIFAKSLTPLEFILDKSIGRESNVIFISASGKNKDIVFAYKEAVQRDCNMITSITMRANNPLMALSNDCIYALNENIILPSGKDGFLATNSLVAFFVIIFRLFNNKTYELKQFDEKYLSSKANIGYEYLIILYSNSTKPVAVDIESKCSEAGLTAVLLCDYRNFGHGRHNWLDKKRKTSIISLQTPLDEKLAKKTISHLPSDIPVVELRSNKTNDPVDLLIKSFWIINKLGVQVNIDPGKPGVPEYGRKLYNLSYINSIKTEYAEGISRKAALAISKKIGMLPTSHQLDQYHPYYKEYINELNRTKYGMIIFDYDATLISPFDKESLPSNGITSILNELLSKGLIIGIASGRGKSIRHTIRKVIERKYWSQVILGFYNSGIINVLDSKDDPYISNDTDTDLKEIELALKADTLLKKLIFELRPTQLSIHLTQDSVIERQRIIEIIASPEFSNLKLVESSHSIDIIRNSVSKSNIISKALPILIERNLPQNILKIGDRGAFPGNDFELLSEPHSLSVDRCSMNVKRCWNLAPFNSRWNIATLSYLKKITFSDRYFKIKF